MGRKRFLECIKININKYIFKEGKVREEHYSYRLARQVFAPFLVPFFLKMRVSANTISLISVIYGAGISVIYAYSSPGLWIAASILMLGSIILDVCDGTIARIRNTTGELGIFTDMIAGKLITISMLFFMSCLFHEFFFIGAIGIISSFISFITSEKRKQLLGGLRNPFLNSSHFNMFNFFITIIIVSLLDLFTGWIFFRLTFFLLLNILLMRQAISEVWNLYG